MSDKLDAFIWRGFIVVFILILIVAFYVALHTTSLTGKITKLVAEPFNHFAVVETDGKRQSVSVSPGDYVLLEVGANCTFLLNNKGEAQSVTCEASR